MKNREKRWTNSRKLCSLWLVLILCVLPVFPVNAAPESAGQAESTVNAENVTNTESTERTTGAEDAMVAAGTDNTDILAEYQEYEKRFAAIDTVEKIEENGYEIDESQMFPVILESFGEEEVNFFSAMETTYRRMAVFIADKEGKILYKGNQLSANYLYRGSLYQPNEGLASVAFQDVNGDGRTDIILIYKCLNDRGNYTSETYKTGEVLFQERGSLYRDWRISDKINRFSMNQSANCIISFVRDGRSTEFLYTATTLEELLKQGFSVADDQCYTRNFEKLGRLTVVPGTFRISQYDVFMIYLVDSQGEIVWCFQPMEDYDNLYALKGISGKDVDGDGMKDLVVLARYSYEGENGEQVVENDCAIYYQRTGGFVEDREFKKRYNLQETDTMEALVTKIREYWGWKVEE